MPAPSPRTNPLADASNAAQRPSGESIPACEKPMNPPGVIITVTPPASAVSPRPAQMCSHADMHRRERRRTGRIHRHARAAQIQAIGNPVRRDAVRAAGRRVRADAGMVERGALDSLVVVVRNPDEDSEIGSVLEIEHHACVLDRLPRRLEQKPLLRIDIRSFARRNAEELRIELIDAVDEATAPDDRFAGQARLRVVIPFHVPPIGRHLDDAFAAFDEKFPE